MAPRATSGGDDSPRIDRRDVLRFRFRRHGLHHPPGSIADIADLALLDQGVQDTGPDGAAWAVRIRGVELDQLDDRFLLAWTIRGAPHAYRRGDAAAVMGATAPFSEADAAKRIYDAATALRAAGIPILEALATVSRLERELAGTPLAKGDLSAALTERLDQPFLRWCRPCQATHPYEQPFRLAALQAGLELEPATSPPVVRRVRGVRPRHFRLAAKVDPRFDVIRNHLRFYGPATPKDTAEFLDSPVAEVTQRWPDDDAIAVEVTASPGERHVLSDDLDDLRSVGDADGDPAVRLLGPYDPYLQLRDRELLVPDPARRKDLWRVLGRPGAVVDDRGEIVATWRPRTSSRSLTVVVEPWTKLTKAARARIGEQAERLAAHRGVDFRAVELT